MDGDNHWLKPGPTNLEANRHTCHRKDKSDLFNTLPVRGKKICCNHYHKHWVTWKICCNHPKSLTRQGWTLTGARKPGAPRFWAGPLSFERKCLFAQCKNYVCGSVGPYAKKVSVHPCLIRWLYRRAMPPKNADRMANCVDLIRSSLNWVYTVRPDLSVQKLMIITVDMKWATSWQNLQNVCAPSKDSDQPGHPPNLISPLCTQWVAKDPSFLHADSKDTDQTGRMPRLICLSWAHMPFCCFCHEAAQIFCNVQTVKVC